MTLHVLAGTRPRPATDENDVFGSLGRCRLYLESLVWVMNDRVGMVVRGLLNPRLCSLIPGLGVKLSTIILAGPTVLSAVGACPPHDGVR